MKYISTLREGERINEIFLCKSKQTAMTKSGKPYDNVILQDKTGTLDAKIWDVGSVGIEEFDAMDYIAITGDITSFQGNLQCSIKRARKVNEGEYDPADYLPVSDTVLQEQFKQLLTEETVTQEDIDTFYTLVDHAQKLDYPTEPIEQIIEEEMAAYLDGVIDEKTTAERIQSRASLYLMEQKVQ